MPLLAIQVTQLLFIAVISLSGNGTSFFYYFTLQDECTLRFAYARGEFV
jgi:hypothetical protein